jgi:hypothetical protein
VGDMLTAGYTPCRNHLPTRYLLLLSLLIVLLCSACALLVLCLCNVSRFIIGAVPDVPGAQVGQGVLLITNEQHPITRRLQEGKEALQVGV